MLKLAETPVYLHPSFMVHMTAGLLDQCTQKLILEIWQVQTLLQSILGKYDVIINSCLLQCNGDEQLATLKKKVC